MRLKRSGLALGLLLSAAHAASPTLRGADDPSATGPARNWVLPLFTPEGFHSMTLRGAEVTLVSSDRIDLVNMNITVFSGTAANRVDTILLSPAASFFPRENRASGDESVRLIRDDIDVTGEQWTYDYAQKKVSIQRSLRVTFRAQLNGILK
jgi:hypothetical protein